MYGESRCSPVRFSALDFEAVIAFAMPIIQYVGNSRWRWILRWMWLWSSCRFETGGQSRCSPVRFSALDFEAVIAVGLRRVGVEWGTRVVCFS
ncbi:hypothetical protein DY000_02026626 [Brassica cretica]|uniref:AMP-dependent synthetase/ligase domain-containing protein n=1 Tax=Brassica cretica TaxID=69181 RepID=A0ABQ7EI09_BRACR|nr:hypothetical protein DY000_02026626 [Brassica cretica]